VNEKAGGGERDHGKRDLSHDKRAAQTATHVAARLTAALSQHQIEVGARRPKSRHEAEEHTCPD
jgi:hypothetical protein